MIFRLPTLKWIQSYELSWILPDVVAGITLALLLIPQALGIFSTQSIISHERPIIDYDCLVKGK